MAQVHKLRPAAPVQRTPERARLAALQAKRSELTAFSARIGDALAKAEARSSDAYAEVARIEREIAEAQEQGRTPDRQRLQTLLGEDSMPSGDALKACLVDAERVASERYQDCRVLREERGEIERRLADLDGDIGAAVQAVAASDPGVQALGDELRRCKVRLMELAAILRAIGCGIAANGLPEPGWSGDWPDVPTAVAAPYLDALRALLRDADAAFPTPPISAVEWVIVDPGPPAA